MNFKVTNLVTAAVLAMSAAFASTASAADSKGFAATNNSDAGASDLHLTVTGTGGDLNAALGVNAAGCAAAGLLPTVSINPANQVNLTWSAACVATTNKVIVNMQTANGPLGNGGGTWTPSGAALGANDVAIVPPTPAFGTPVFAALLALLVAVGGAFVLRKGSRVSV
jgi:hypothetical protein